jgi:hypothetical protein
MRFPTYSPPMIFVPAHFFTSACIIIIKVEVPYVFIELSALSLPLGLISVLR